MPTFADAVDAADKRSAEEQECLLRILRHRIAERTRAQLAADVAEARAESVSGGGSTRDGARDHGCCPMTHAIPRLKAHKLSGELEEVWACSAGYNLRNLFEFVEHEGDEAILLLTVGTHDEVY
jgi:hypothetical protein